MKEEREGKIKWSESCLDHDKEEERRIFSKCLRYSSMESLSLIRCSLFKRERERGEKKEREKEERERGNEVARKIEKTGGVGWKGQDWRVSIMPWQGRRERERKKERESQFCEWVSCDSGHRHESVLETFSFEF